MTTRMDVPILVPVLDVARRRWWQIVAALFAVAAVALGFVPLLSTMGLEWAMAFTVPASLAAGAAGIAVAHAARGKRLEPLALWAASFPVTLGPLVAPMLVGFAHGLHVRNCNPGQSAVFWVLGPVASALYASAIGVALGRVVEKPRRAHLVFAAFVVVTVARLVLTLMGGPVTAGGNHFFGWYPGPIYEEAVGVLPAFWYLRLLSILIAFLVLLASGFWGERAPGDAPRAGALSMVALALIPALSFRQQMHLDVDRDYLRTHVLTATLHTAHFDIHYQPGGNPEKLERIAREHEFRLALVCAFLGVEPSRRITSWYYPSNASKKAWTGAGRVQVANPWKREIYVDDEGNVLQHEITHVVAAEFAPRPFGISLVDGVVPNMALIEGVAVASDWHDEGQGTPHEESAAMMKNGLLPDPDALMGLKFWGGRGAQSYTAAGSFLRFLAERYGVEKVRKAYAWSDFRGAFGKDLGALADEWRAFLTTVPVPAKRSAAAREHFTRPSIFERTCARELALLAEAGDHAMGENRVDDAVAAYRRWEAVDDRTDPLKRLQWAMRVKGDLGAASKIAEQVVDREVPDSPGYWAARMAQADLAWVRGRPADARGIYAEIFEAHVTSDLDRQAWARKTAAAIAMGDDAALAAALRDWLLPDPQGSHEARIVALTEAARASRGTRDAFLADYLLGRYLLQSNAPAAALPWLERARGAIDGGAAPDAPAIRAETWSMLADAWLRTGRYAESAKAWEKVQDLPGVGGDVRDRALDGAAKTAWAAGHDALGRPR